MKESSKTKRALETFLRLGAKFEVWSPDGELCYLGPDEASRYADDPTAYWCERYGITKKEYRAFYRSFHKDGNRCLGRTRAGARCKNRYQCDTSNLRDWLQRYYRANRCFCTVHGGFSNADLQRGWRNR